MVKQREQSAGKITLSLNISPCHFRNIEAFTQKLLALIEEYGIDTRYLVFEITESAYIRNREEYSLQRCRDQRSRRFFDSGRV